jgi:hypothetical protein
LGSRGLILLAEDVLENGQGEGGQPLDLAVIEFDRPRNWDAINSRRTALPKVEGERSNLLHRLTSQEEKRRRFPVKCGRARQRQGHDIELRGLAQGGPDLGLYAHLVLLLLLGADGEPGVAHGGQLLGEGGPQVLIEILVFDQYEAHLKGRRTLGDCLARVDLPCGAPDGRRVRQSHLTLVAAGHRKHDVVGGQIDFGRVRERGHEGCQANQALLVV